MALRASHLAGKENVMADALSRGKFNGNEWCLSRTWAVFIFSLYGRPMIDLFATEENARLPLFVTRGFNPQAWRTDVLSFDWTGLQAYASPPLCLIQKVLTAFDSVNTDVLLVAPCWPNKPWFPCLLKLLVDLPFRFPEKKLLLTQSRGRVWLSNLDHLHLCAWNLSGDCCNQRAFRKRLLRSQQGHGDRPRLELTVHDWRSSSFGQSLTIVIPWKLQSGKSPPS